MPRLAMPCFSALPIILLLRQLVAGIWRYLPIMLLTPSLSVVTCVPQPLQRALGWNNLWGLGWNNRWGLHEHIAFMRSVRTKLIGFLTLRVL